MAAEGDRRQEDRRRTSAKGYKAENINLTAKRNIIMNALTTRAAEEQEARLPNYKVVSLGREQVTFDPRSQTQIPELRCES